MFDTGFWVIASVWFVVMLFMALLLWRNKQVYAFRVNLIYKDLGQYKALPSYNRMVLTFWRPMAAYSPKGNADV